MERVQEEEAEQRCAPRQMEPWGAKEAELRGKNRIKVS